MLKSEWRIKIKCSYWSRMTPSPLATCSNQNALTEYVDLCFNLGRIDQVIDRKRDKRTGRSRWCLQRANGRKGEAGHSHSKRFPTKGSCDLQLKHFRWQDGAEGFQRREDLLVRGPPTPGRVLGLIWSSEAERSRGKEPFQVDKGLSRSLE